jgi:hypothetical protein
MTKFSFVLVSALALAAFGCKKKGGDCAGAIDHSMEMSKAQMSKMPGMDDKMMGKLKDLAVQHCQEDKWSDEVTKCMSDAKAEADSQGCFSKLTKEQQEKMNKAMMEVVMKSAGGGHMGGAGAEGAGGAAGGGGSAMGGEPGAGSAPAGSGSAPAGSGSAPAGSGSAPAGSAAAPAK